MCRNGMQINTNKKLGVDFTLSQLTEDYDAVCLAVGASQAVEMTYPGSDSDGCYLGVDYLKDYVTEQRYVTGKKWRLLVVATPRSIVPERRDEQGLIQR